jgi:hypothetical protein
VGELAVVGIMNSPGTLIMTVADLGAMHLNAKVAETDIARVAVGQDAKIYVNAYKDDPFDGNVSEIALQRTVEKDGTGSFKVLVNLDLKGRQIFSGLTGNVDIDIARQEGLLVPSQAVVERPVNDLPESVKSSPLVQKNRRVTTVVFRVVDGKAVVTPVVTGPRRTERRRHHHHRAVPFAREDQGRRGRREGGSLEGREPMGGGRGSPRSERWRDGAAHGRWAQGHALSPP